jgi:hypothetical protein
LRYKSEFSELFVPCQWRAFAFPLRGRWIAEGKTDEVEIQKKHAALRLHLISHFVTASPQGEANG